MSTLGKGFKVCATCAYFECPRAVKGINFVEFDSQIPGKCYRDFPQGISRPPMQSCSKWEIWPPINR